MAYTLKASGLATRLTMCLAVDEDNTVKEFVSSTVNSAMTVHAGVTVASASWKGSSRKYFQTYKIDDNNPKAVEFGATKPSLAFDAAGGSLFVACAGRTAGSGTVGFIETPGQSRVYAMAAGMYTYLPETKYSSTTLPTDGTTAFSIAHKCVGPGAYKFMYGLESASDVAEDGSGTVGFEQSSLSIGYVCGSPAQGTQPGKWHIIATFTDAISDAEIQQLHDDWFGTLFDAGAGGAVSAINTIRSAQMGAFNSAVFRGA